MRSHDNPPKNWVRGAWMDFLPASFDTARSVVGLYLPGPENLELAHYLNKGVAPRQLVGCERNLRVLPDVLRNARGVRIVAGTLSDAVEILMREEVRPIHFANLDFDGGYETHVADIFATLRLLVPGVGTPVDLALTSYAARAHSLRSGSLHASKFHSTLSDHELVHTQLGAMERRYKVAARTLSSSYAESFGHLRRELGFMWWLVMGLGLMDVAPSGYGEFNARFLRQHLSPCIQRIEVELTRSPSVNGQIQLVREPSLKSAMEERVVRLWPSAFRHILYYSPRNQPMQTWFLKVWYVEEDRFTLRDLCRQVWDLVARTPLTLVSSDGTVVTIGHP